ncbi:hypothetical protein [Meridianimarinicoccus roseus]
MGFLSVIRRWALRDKMPILADQVPDWLDRMLARKPVKVVAVALAARMARTVWALIAREDSYRTMPS